MTNPHNTVLQIRASDLLTICQTKFCPGSTIPASQCEAIVRQVPVVKANRWSGFPCCEMGVINRKDMTTCSCPLTAHLYHGRIF